jgi:putative spermidine/putrescine transport system substrate-binding protein
MKRRHLLQSAGILALEPLLFGCQSKTNAVKIQFLKGSLPALLTGEFQKLLKSDIEFSVVAQLADSLALLTKWQNPVQTSGSFPWQSPSSVQPANLITLGDAWLATAIEKKLIEPLHLAQLPSWQQLEPKWQELVTRDGQIWGAPYRWGSTVLVYRRDRLSQNGIPMPTDWSDLWRPQLQGRISLLNQQQEVIGLTLKHLGHSYNTDPQTVSELPAQLRQLHQQTILYSSDNYLSPLLAGDTWVAMAWSNDVSDLVSRIPNLGVATPQAGTSLWADLWVQPQAAQLEAKSTAVEQWIDFCWQPLAASKISQFTTGLSPVFTPEAQAQLPSEMRARNATIFSKGEFLQRLSPDRQQAYQSLWLEMQSRSTR